VRHLHDRGWDRIGFLGWPAGSPVGDDRRRGWERATQDLGVHHPEWSVETSQDVSRAAESAAQVIDRIGHGGAFVCASDVLAIGAWEVLAERGWRVGRDFALVGFDDSPLAASLRLTSVRQPLAAVADRVLDLLVDPDPSPPAEGVLLDPELVVRASSAPAGNRPTEGSST
jgi:LacI family transcriptional regulator